MALYTYQQAINIALRDELRRDETVYVMGEDIAQYGGCYGVTAGLYDEFGGERVINTPISEIAIVGNAIGSAMMGLRPVVEIMYADFLFVCADQIINQAPKMRYVLGGDTKVPLVIRTAFGGGGRYSYNHSQSNEASFLNAPGLTIMMPSTPKDAKGMLKAAIRSNNPVLFFEQKHLYKTISEEIPDDDYIIPIGKGDIKREGKDVTIVATGWMIHKSLKAAEMLAKEGFDVEIIDPRTLKPLDKDLILNSVKKTGKLVIVHEASVTGGFGAEVSAVVNEEGFEYLKKPIKRVAAPDMIIPFAPNCEDAFYPDVNRIAETVRALM